MQDDVGQGSGHEVRQRDRIVDVREGDVPRVSPVNRGVDRPQPRRR